MLDRLNRLPWVRVHEVCAGHGSRQRGQPAYLVLEAQVPGRYSLIDLAHHLKALSSTEYEATVAYYKSNGERYAVWRMRVECDRRGPAPLSWWRGLVDLLE